MADFTLSIDLVTNLKKAQQDVKKTKIEFQLLGKTIKLDKERLKKSFATVTAAAGGMFAAIAKASPSMRVAFKQMEIAGFLASLAIGEALAPALEQTLVPAINTASEWIQNLDSDMRLFIGVVISLTFFIGLLAAVVVTLGIELLIVIGIVALVVAALALLYLAYKNNTYGIGTLIDKIADVAIPVLEELIDAFKYLWDAIQPIKPLLLVLVGVGLLPFVVAIGLTVLSLIAVAYAVGALINFLVWLGRKIKGIIQWFVDLGKKLGIAKLAFIVFTGGAGAAILVLWELIKKVFNFFGINIVKKIKEAKNKVVDAFKKMGDNIKLVFESIWVWFGNQIDWILGKIEDLIGVIKDAKKILEGAGDLISGVGDVIGFQEGGTVPQTGLIFAHKGEEVMRGVEARQYRRDRGFGFGNGRGGGDTYNYHNTYVIKAVNPRAIAKEIDAIQKRQSSKRFTL